MIKKMILPICATAVVGCASHPDKIDAAYVSPLKYQDYSCPQLAQEMSYVENRTTALYNRLKSQRNADNWQMGVGLLVFWPTLFMLEGGDGPDAAEYAQLKGNYEALRSNTVQKNCAIASRSPDEVMKQYDQQERAKTGPRQSKQRTADRNPAPTSTVQPADHVQQTQQAQQVQHFESAESYRAARQAELDREYEEMKRRETEEAYRRRNQL